MYSLFTAHIAKQDHERHPLRRLRGVNGILVNNINFLLSSIEHTMNGDITLGNAGWLWLVLMKHKMF